MEARTRNPVGAAKVDRAAVSKSQVRSSPEGQFERFETLASKLIQVPKSELDEKRRTERDAG
jgi:hypothetical protein